jgi:hypothetical protein
MCHDDGDLGSIVPQLDRGSSAAWKRARFLILARLAVSLLVEANSLHEIVPAKNPDRTAGDLFSA